MVTRNLTMTAYWMSGLPEHADCEAQASGRPEPLVTTWPGSLGSSPKRYQGQLDRGK